MRIAHVTNLGWYQPQPNPYGTIPQNMGLPLNQNSESLFGQNSSSQSAGKGLSVKQYLLLAGGTVVALGVFAGLITLAVFLVQNEEGSTTATTSRSTLSTTVATTTVATTTIATTTMATTTVATTTVVTTTVATTTVSTTTVLNVVTGTQNYAVELAASGYHGVQKVRYYAATNTGSAMRYDYPIVYLSGTTFSGSYVNNAWYGLHAGCGNVNGIASCTAVCKALGKSYISITTTCTTGYSGSVTTYSNPNRCVYTGSDTTSAPWVDYGAASTCGNAMAFCTCSL